MPYVTSIERLAKQEGRELGRAEAQQEGRTRLVSLVRRQLGRRFGVLPDWVEARLDSASDDTLLQWAERLVVAPDLATVFEP